MSLRERKPALLHLKVTLCQILSVTKEFGKYILKEEKQNKAWSKTQWENNFGNASVFIKESRFIILPM